ncbi:branched-chain amino acid ABC transporter permease [Archaeoglobus sp.]
MAWEIVTTILFWFGLYAIVAISLNLEYGYAGIPNFGRCLAVVVGAVAVGGIVVRILMFMFNVSGQFLIASGQASSIANDIIAQNPFFGIGLLVLSLIIAFLIGIVVGAIFILPSAKLSEDYLAITLLAISEVVLQIFYYNTDIAGGYYGVSIPDVLSFVSSGRDTIFVGIILVVAFLVFVFAEKLLNTPYGRILRAMRENENVVKAFGRDIMLLRVKTVAIGSGIASLAGALYALYTANVIGILNLYSRVYWTFLPFLMIILGGLSNNRGVLAGAFVFAITKVLLETYKFEIKTLLHIPFSSTWLGYMLFGAITLLILYYRPEGLIKEKPIATKPIKERMKKG